MTDHNVKKLKTLGKRYARATAMAHTEALNVLAAELGFAHWKALSDASKEDWLPSDEDLAKTGEIVRQAGAKTEAAESRGEFTCIDDPAPEEGELCGHKYRIGDYLGDVVVSGEGWDLRIPEAPYKAPIAEIDERYAESSPIKDPSFLADLLKIAKARSTRMRAKIAVDWPRRSTKADLDGVARHPLRGGEASTWYCHCEQSMIASATISTGLTVGWTLRSSMRPARKVLAPA